MPTGPGHAHPEDLPWLEVPHLLPADEEEPDSGVGLVPQICRKQEKHGNNTKKNNFESPDRRLIFTSFSFSLLQQQKKYIKIKSATTVVQSYARGWQVRVHLPEQGIVFHCALTLKLRVSVLSLVVQARKLLRELKYQKKCEEAVTTIAAYWHGTQVTRPSAVHP